MLKSRGVDTVGVDPTSASIALLIANLTSFNTACADSGWVNDEEGRRAY